MSDVVRLENTHIIVCVSGVVLSTLALYFFQAGLSRASDTYFIMYMLWSFLLGSPPFAVLSSEKSNVCSLASDCGCSRMSSGSCTPVLLTENTTASTHSVLHSLPLPPGFLHLSHGIFVSRSHVSLCLLSHFWSESIFSLPVLLVRLST